MNHGQHFDRSNRADRLHIERKRKEREARERLEKAAPDLLKACYEARSIIQTDQRYPGFARSCNCGHCTMCKLNAAIAKAEKGA